MWRRRARPGGGASRRALALVGLVAAGALLGAVRIEDSAAAVQCDAWASTAGDDVENPGTQADPVRSVQKLIEILSDPGDAGARNGCLVAGETFVEPVSTFIVNAFGGTDGDPVVIQSSGAPRATIRAQAWLKDISHDITFTDINFVGYVGASMLIIDGDRITFRNNDITYPDGICVDVGILQGQGGPAGPPADDFVLDRNRIHNCGTSRQWNTLGSSGVHGIYIKNTNDAVVTNNVIFDNMNRGVQLFPLAQHTLVEFNVIDGNSSNVNIGSFQDRFSENNVVRNNIITNALLMEIVDPVGWPVDGDQWNVYGNFPVGHQPVTNIVTGNCVWFENPNFRQPQYYFGGNGVDYNGNTEVDPLYVNRAAKDFALQPGSPCAGKGPQPEVTTTCNGSAPTITGTESNDTLTGTAGVDVIMGLGGNDVIYGLAGGDKICAGDGDDVVYPGPGSEFAPLPAPPNVDGGAGTDTISYADTAFCSNINLTNGDMFHPGTCSGNDGEYDKFTGFENAIGGNFNDTLLGSPIANQLEGGGANDVLHGYPGNDVLVGGAGTDEFHGWEGNDTLLARDGVGGEQLGCGPDMDTATKDASDVPTDCETLIEGSPFGDYDGDGAADFAIYRPAERTWYIRGVPPFVQWGGVGDIPVPGDYNGDGTTEIAVYSPDDGIWFVRGQTPAQWQQWGIPGSATEIPVPADYDGNNTTDVAIYRQPSATFFVKGQFTLQLGQVGDIPVPGNYDADPMVEAAVYRPSTRTWLIDAGGGQVTQVQWGNVGDVPAPGDFNGDGQTDITTYSPADGYWWPKDQTPYIKWGAIAGDVPVPGSYVADASDTDERTIYRRAAGFENGVWYIQGAPTLWAQWGGQANDVVLGVPPALWLQYYD